MRRLLLLLCLPGVALSLEYVWQITDIHVDDNYVATGSPADFCHTADGQEERWFGRRGCGLPWRTVQLAVDFMRNTLPKSSAILWTGDTAPHWPYTDWDKVFPKLRRVTSMLRTAFPDTQIIPSIGNHDAYPSDQFPSENSTFYERYLVESGWSEILPESARATFRKGGYYRVDVNGIRYLVLNTALYYYKNRLTRDDGGRDPTGQLEWLKEELSSHSSFTPTVVTGHIAPGFAHWSIYEMQLRGNENYQLLKILMENGWEGRVANIFGHEHIDTFKNAYRRDITFDQHTSAVNTFFLAPALFPGTLTQDVNPSVRLYAMIQPAILNDYIQSHMDLEAANAAHREDPAVQGIDFWKITYRVRERYGLGDVSRGAMHQFFKELKSDRAVFDRFWKMTGGDHANVPACNDTCYRQQVCIMSALDSQSMADCLSGAPRAMVSFLVMTLALVAGQWAA